VPRKTLYYWAAKAKRIFDSYPNHPGLLQATSELQKLLDRASKAVAEGLPTDAAERHLAKLAAHGATPMTVLLMVMAVALEDRDNGGNLLRNTRQYHFAVGKAVADLIPKGELKERSRTLSALGSLLVGRYSVLAGPVAQALDETSDKERARAANMTAPFPA
jgi:hypothetical protein